jgi:hypothetical protein
MRGNITGYDFNRMVVLSSMMDGPRRKRERNPASRASQRG